MTRTQALRPVAPWTADVSTASGPEKAVVLGTVGGRAVVRWEGGPRAGQLGWVPPGVVVASDTAVLSPEDGVVPAQRSDPADPRLRCTARPAAPAS